MQLDLLTALVAFAFVSSITPGPNNLMLMASGANYGFWRTIPHMLGVGIGFTLMIVLVGLGLIGIFDRYPLSYTILTIFSLGYLAWLAVKIATASAPRRGTVTGTPMTFLQAAIFQWVNPKAWAMALTAITAYAPDRSVPAILVVAGIFGIINLPSVSIWTVIGQEIRRFLGSPVRLRTFNWTMAALLIASMAPLVRL